ncbi:MAG: T9SS type A sorting domain-containing protein [Bacteroidota bacterium]
MCAPPSIRRLAAALLLALLAPGLAAQSLHARIVDPLTGEPVPLGLTAPPTGPARSGGGSDLELRQYLPEGSTKLVRALPGGLTVLHQNGAALVATALDGPAEPPEMYPLELGRVVLGAQPTDLVLRDDLAFAALRKDAGLLVLDVNDPADLREVGRAEGRDLLAVAVAGDYAYAGAGTSGIVVYNVSDPAAPAEVATLGTPGSANGMWVDGQTLYVATGVDGLRIYDLADPEAPSPIAAFGTDGEFATYVRVHDGVAWLTGGFGLVALGVSDPAAPDSLGSFSTGGETTYEIAFDEDTAYLPGLDGLRALDVADPAAIAETAFFPASQALSVDVGGTALVAERFKGFYSLSGSNLFEEAFVAGAGFSHKVFFDGDLLYVTDLAGQLRVIDAGGEAAAEIARVDVPPNTQEVVVAGGRAYVTDSDFGGTGLTILDVSDPADPQIVGSYGFGNQAFGLDVVGTTVYLAGGFSGLLVLDASDPGAVTELGSFPIGSNAVDVTVRDDIAYLVSFGGGMLTLDVSDPANIAQLDAEPFGFLNAIDLDQETFGLSALVADGQEGLRLVDVSDPDSIVSVGTVPTLTQARDVDASVGLFEDVLIPLAYVADDFYGLREFENGQVESGSFESSDRGIGVAVQPFDSADASIIALAAGETGVYLFETPFFTANESGVGKGTLSLAAPFPNPVRGMATLRYTLPEAADVTLAVYDVLGRRVATLRDGVQPAGVHGATFDAGTLPSGVYLVRLAAGTDRAAKRLTVVR